jgi:cytoskeletal protein CcmA (bactofilin family)
MDAEFRTETSGLHLAVDRPSMALFGKERDGTAGDVRPGEEAMAERSGLPGGAGVDAFLGKGTKISGKLVFEGTGRIEGQVDGEIAAQDVLTIGEGAVVNAKIAGTTVVIDGTVTGDVTARQRVELRASARVHGNVTTPSLAVQEGAVLNGQCSMTGGEARTGRAAPDLAARTLDQARDATKQVAAAIPAQR